MTEYGKRVPGGKRNHYFVVSFDYTDGFLGISQFEQNEGPLTDRVLLSPDQVNELLRFLKGRVSSPR